MPAGIDMRRHYWCFRFDKPPLGADARKAG
jgi:hypothetical protein